MERLKNGIKQIRFKDLLAPLIFLVTLIPSLIFKLRNKIIGRKLWLICEDRDTARDNGYYFYKYVRENHPEDYCFYAINKKSHDYAKVKKLGSIIQFGGLRHWLYYLAADLNISSQKSGNPSPIFFYLLHVKLGLYQNRVFLQHGITKDDSKWLYYNQTKFKYFVCGAKREYDYILKNFGYKPENLLLTGFPRWDTLKNKITKEKTILIMPTWRNWLGKDKNAVFKTRNFQETDFFKRWNNLLNNKKFIEFIEENNVAVYFYPHIHMQKFLSSFSSSSKNIKILPAEYDIQEYLNKCSMMVTDYSSAAFDFALLNKPVLYYQFDVNKYRKYQLQQGYFSYEKDGFGEVIKDEKSLVDQIVKIAISGFKNKKKYINRSDKFFSKNDRKNCERVYHSMYASGTISKYMRGRLGNQLFQYATIRSIQEVNGGTDAIKLNFSKYVYSRGFQDNLAHFNTRPYEEVESIRFSLAQLSYVVWHKVIKRICRLICKKRYYTFRARFENKMSKKLQKVGLYWKEDGAIDIGATKVDNKIVIGHFESKKNFDNIRDKLINELTPKEKPLQKNGQLYKIINKSNSVCVSVRRGDFIHNSKFEKKFNVCDKEYFRNAVRAIKKYVKDPTFIIFSDDISWCKQNLKIDGKVYYEDGTDPVWEKLRLMYSCKHFIISNSTFSWWAQYLSRNNNKVVVAPILWQKTGYNEEIYDRNWILIDNVRGKKYD